MISVVIPTYKEPDHLDLCIKSCITGAHHPTEIIVVVDGFYNLNKSVLDKYPTVKILNFEQNRGLSIATNVGVYNASRDFVLIVNDDNVFPKNWDVKLLEDLAPRMVLTPNQIEPSPSIFNQFVSKNLGLDPTTFDLNRFWDIASDISIDKVDFSGSTLPFAMRKRDFLAVGGWDELYPSPHVVDWDFFLKCEYFDFSMYRTYKSHFYHFASAATRSTPEQNRISSEKEMRGKHFYAQKWGFAPYHNPEDNSKIPPDFR